MTRPEIPLALRIVIGLFFLHGIIGFVKLVVSAMDGRLLLDLGVLGIFVGFGLLRLSRGWQVVALLYLLIMMVIVPLFFLLIVVAEVGLSQVPPIAFLGALFWIGVAIWSYRVLSRDDVHRLFVPPEPAPAFPERPRVRRSRPVFDEPPDEK